MENKITENKETILYGVGIMIPMNGYRDVFYMINGKQVDPKDYPRVFPFIAFENE